jgi:hypothetical protein
MMLAKRHPFWRKGESDSSPPKRWGEDQRLGARSRGEDQSAVPMRGALATPSREHRTPFVREPGFKKSGAVWRSAPA